MVLYFFSTYIIFPFMRSNNHSISTHGMVVLFFRYTKHQLHTPLFLQPLILEKTTKPSRLSVILIKSYTISYAKKKKK